MCISACKRFNILNILAFWFYVISGKVPCGFERNGLRGFSGNVVEVYWKQRRSPSRHFSGNFPCVWFFYFFLPVDFLQLRIIVVARVALTMTRCSLTRAHLVLRHQHPWLFEFSIYLFSPSLNIGVFCSSAPKFRCKYSTQSNFMDITVNTQLRMEGLIVPFAAKSAPPYFFDKLRENSTDYYLFWYTTSWKYVTPEKYTCKWVYLTYKLLPHHLRKCIRWFFNYIQQKHSL